MAINYNLGFSRDTKNGAHSKRAIKKGKSDYPKSIKKRTSSHYFIGYGGFSESIFYSPQTKNRSRTSKRYTDKEKKKTDDLHGILIEKRNKEDNPPSKDVVLSSMNSFFGEEGTTYDTHMFRTGHYQIMSFLIASAFQENPYLLSMFKRGNTKVVDLGVGSGYPLTSILDSFIFPEIKNGLRGYSLFGVDLNPISLVLFQQRILRHIINFVHRHQIDDYSLILLNATVADGRKIVTPMSIDAATGFFSNPMMFVELLKKFNITSVDQINLLLLPEDLKKKTIISHFFDVKGKGSLPTSLSYLSNNEIDVLLKKNKNESSRLLALKVSFINSDASELSGRDKRKLIGADLVLVSYCFHWFRGLEGKRKAASLIRDVLRDKGIFMSIEEWPLMVTPKIELTDFHRDLAEKISDATTPISPDDLDKLLKKEGLIKINEYSNKINEEHDMYLKLFMKKQTPKN